VPQGLLLMRMTATLAPGQRRCVRPSQCKSQTWYRMLLTLTGISLPPNRPTCQLLCPDKRLKQGGVRKGMGIVNHNVAGGLGAGACACRWSSDLNLCGCLVLHRAYTGA
jgi:hypothetical protein